ncbi:sigma-54-dependent Fis family transcriptional regulator [Zavarzinella formosa]|uniref:sigma-54-dependent Fis family transcriptional regulator n=1 Tax=Zavarzinella formosa TaxID=360055 RepID=UPI000364510A|nr:sigma-54-dependent Fis family transcriptional regulator [Zavarzinella formosa]
MAAPTTAFLVARHEEGFGDVHALQQGVTYGLGRSPKNRIVLADDLCSRDHAEISYAEESWYVRDLGSLNGTKINGKPLVGEAEIDTGDDVQFGRGKYLFLYDLDDLPGIPVPQEKPLAEAVNITRRTTKTKYVPSESGGIRNTDDTVADAPKERALETLYRTALDMANAEDGAALGNAVLAGCFNAMPAEHGAVMSVKTGRELELMAYRSRDGKVRTFHKASQLVSSTVLDTKEAVLAENALADPQFKGRDSIRELRVGSLICVPVLAEGAEVLGLIHLYSTPNERFTDDHLDFAVAIGRHMAGAWQQLRKQDLLHATNRELRAALGLESELVGSSTGLRNITSQISRVATTGATVLIRGESGSGKELVARAIHNLSNRKNAPFVTLNCAALTESLLESELFGHERGAFTGATEKMIGKFEAADHGTIFLDEIGEMHLSTQSKFLRVLEGHPFERLGGNNHIKVDVRVVAATNRPLEQAVREGVFRKDLFYRLQVVEIRVPPLRDRLEDVAPLAEHFLKRFTRETGRRIKGFTEDAKAKLKNYAWPGNVRELRNVVERAVALNDKPFLDAVDIWLTSLDPSSSGNHPVLYKPVSLEETEKRHIRETLKYTDWNKSRAAEILEIERSTLDRKIKGYNIRKE